jgi:hypothetical protein
MREHGFGRCKVEPDHAKRISRTFSTQNLCRLDKFAKAPVAVIARRERELA